MFRAYDSIDPANMTADESRYLGRLLLKIHAEKGAVYFPSGTSNYYLSGPLGDEAITLNLLSPIIIRKSKHRPDQLRLEVIGKEIGFGGYSHVYKIVHTLVPQVDGSLVSHNKERVVKVQTEKPKDYVNAEKEYSQASLISHLHVKPPVYSLQTGQVLSFMVGGFMFGSSLDSFLKHGARSRKFSLDDRLRLSVELIRALREQVHAQGIVHRDIKPGNIIVTAGDGKSPHSFIIDFGLSKSVTINDNVKCGTCRYFAPEIWKSENATQATDIYSLGVILSQLWGAPLPAVPTYETTINRQFPGIFTHIHGLTPAQQAMLKHAIMKMCANAQVDRGSLDEAEHAFNHVRFELGLNLEDKKSREMLENVHALGRRLRQDIQKYCAINGDKWNINTVRREMESVMTRFPDKPQFVREFISELGIRALENLTDKESIRRKMKSITADFIFAREDSGLVLNALSAMVSNGMQDFDQDYTEYLKQTISNCMRRNVLLPLSVDDVVELTQKSHHDAEKMKNEIEFIHQARIASGVIHAPVRPLMTSKLSARYQGLFRENLRPKEAPIATEWGIPRVSAFSPFIR